MIVAFLITIPVLALSYLMGWALWRLANNQPQKLLPTPLQANDDPGDWPKPTSLAKLHAEKPVPKRTPTANRFYIPPPYFSSQRVGGSGALLSGRGPSDWSFQHRLTPRHYRRRRRLNLLR